MYALGYPLLTAVSILDVLLTIYICIIIAVAIFSWLTQTPSTPWYAFCAILPSL